MDALKAVNLFNATKPIMLIGNVGGMVSWGLETTNLSTESYSDY